MPVDTIDVDNTPPNGAQFALETGLASDSASRKTAKPMEDDAVQRMRGAPRRERTQATA
ncbi:MAG: hypothetical protein RR969_08510 [Thermomonas sp.]